MHMGDNPEGSDRGQLAPVQYWIRQKDKKVSCSRGPTAAEERKASGYEEVTAQGFHGFIQKVQSTHRRKGKK